MTPIKHEVFAGSQRVGCFQTSPDGAREGHGAHDAAYGVAMLALQAGNAVTIRTTFRQDTPLGPVNRVTVARY